MTTQLLLVLVLVLNPTAAGTWVLAAVRTDRPLLWVVLATGVTTAWIAVLGSLWARGWWFVQEQVLVTLPLVVVALVGVGLTLNRDARTRRPRSPSTLVAILACAYACAAGVVLALVVGYPVGPLSAGVVVAVVVGATALTDVLLTRGSKRLVVGLAAVLAVVLVGSVGSAWLADRSTVIVGDPHGAHDMAGMGDTAANGSTPVTDLRIPADTQGVVRRVDLVARQQQVTLPSGKRVSAWTFGSLPGPAIEATVGEVVEVHLTNRDVAAGVTLHWHGYDVPNGDDGVAGVTQNAVLPGKSFTYRFVARQVGTYWYHTHQDSLEGLRRGLYGVLVVRPSASPVADVDVSLPLHTISGREILGASDLLTRQAVPAGASVRLRLVNTDQVPQTFGLTGTSYRVLALDGTDVSGPTPISGQALRIPAGGRVDVGFTMPASRVRLSVSGVEAVGVLLAPDAEAPDPGADVPDRVFDPMSYGSLRAEPGMAGPFAQTVTFVLDRQPRFFQGAPSYAYTINGQVYPHIPSITVDQGDLIKIRVVNRSFETHPMHPHGHHVLVLSVDGRVPTGGPVWLDTFDVQPGQVWEVALRANNPGIWMDHCHNLDHAANGMMMHLIYRGVTTPFVLGGATDNDPE